MRAESSFYHQRVLSWGPPTCVSPGADTHVTHVRLDDVLVLTLNIPWLWPHAPAWYIVSSAAPSSPDVVRPLNSPHIMLSASCLLCLLASVACVLGDTEDGQPRVGWAVTSDWDIVWYSQVFASRYYSINSAGASTLTFNATSIQNGVILGFLLLVLGVLILPLFGVNLLASDEVSQEESVNSSDYHLLISVHFCQHRQCVLRPGLLQLCQEDRAGEPGGARHVRPPQGQEALRWRGGQLTFMNLTVTNKLISH